VEVFDRSEMSIDYMASLPKRLYSSFDIMNYWTLSVKENTTFQKLDLFPSSGEKVGAIRILDDE
jgi:hypothetical protein